MRSFISGNSLSGNRNYEIVVNSYLEESSFLDYHLAVIYFQNFDIGNIKQWRDRNGGKFRWMLYDQDYGFHLWPPEVYVPAMKRDYADYDNMFTFYTNASGSGTGWPNASGRTLLLRKMLENEGFRRKFISRCADLLNQDFSSDRVLGIIDEMAAVIRPEMARHLARWSWESLVARDHGSPFKEEDVSYEVARWEENVQGMRDYAVERPGKLRNDLMAHFRLQGGTFELEVQVEGGAGQVQVNSLQLDSFPWKGIYFKGIPVQLTAIPPDGMQVEGWRVDGVERNENPLELSAEELDRREVVAIYGFLP